MHSIDWAIVGAYCVAAIAIGIGFARRASRSSEDFFVAGRSLPWFVAGTSMVASTFSSDTPLWVSGAVRSGGISAAWILWANMIGTLVTVFYFARLWRRSKVLTDVEFVAKRYDDSRIARGLRVFKSFFDGVFVNCVILASVTLAMSKVLTVVLGLSTEPLFVMPLIGDVTPGTLILFGLSVSAMLYTVLSGLYGVVYTDLVQFGLAMVGAIALAVIVYVDLAPQGGFVAALAATPNFDIQSISFLPEFGFNLPTATFLILATVGWFFLAPGYGYFLQRVLATRSEKDAMLSIYWYCFCNYILRSWPWIVVGIASLIYFPNLVDAESSYPNMLQELLPIGLKGIMVASLLAAFMSTFDTHLNWGSSYLVNDVYKPFVRRSASNRHYVQVGRLAMLVLMFIAAIVATKLTGLLNAYKYLGVFWAGISFVLIARWYWWRINAWSEVATYLCAAVFGNLTFFILPDQGDQDWFAIRWLANFVVSTVVCVLVTYLTSSPGPTSHVKDFYRQLRVHGRGWRRVRDETGVEPEDANLAQNTRAFLASNVFMFSMLFAFGYAFFGQWQLCAVSSGFCVASAVYLMGQRTSLLR